MGRNREGNAGIHDFKTLKSNIIKKKKYLTKRQTPKQQVIQRLRHVNTRLYIMKRSKLSFFLQTSKTRKCTKIITPPKLFQRFQTKT